MYLLGGAAPDGTPVTPKYLGQRRLIEVARENGIGRLHAMVMRENIGMLSLLRSLDLPERKHWEDGTEHVEVDLEPGTAA